MKHVKGVLAAVAVAALMSSGALAQTGEMYVSKSGDKWMFHGGANASAEGSEILKAEAGAKPANCAEGAYWLNDNQMVVGCSDDKEYGFAKIPEGGKRASGEDFPADSYLVQEGGMSMGDVSK